MNQLAKELTENPQLAADLAAMAGQVSLAYVANKIALMNRENDELRQQLAEARSTANRASLDNQALEDRCRKKFESIGSQIKILQNQILDTKK